MCKGLSCTGLDKPFLLLSWAIACLLLVSQTVSAAPKYTPASNVADNLSVDKGFKTEFEGLDFRLNKQKEAVIIVKLSSSASAVDIKKNTEGLDIELLYTAVKMMIFMLLT